MTLAPLLFALALTQGPGPEPLARARLQPGEIVTVGQPISIIVEVLVPSYFTGAPRFPDIDLEDAIVLFEPRGSNFTERVEGQTYAGQSRRYVVYPQRPGGFDVASIPVAVRYFADGVGPGAEATVSPPRLRFEARLPPEAEGLSYFIGASGLTLEEAFEPRPEILRVGEAFTRQITTTVEGALSMVIPPLEPEAIPGLGVYPAAPVTADRGGERGERFVGTRVESVTYVAEEQGSYRLPAVERVWWDVAAERLRRETLSELTFEVVANPELAVEFVPAPEQEAGDEAVADASRFSLLDWLRRNRLALVAAALLALIAFRIARRYGPRLRQRFKNARRRRAESEETYFRRFRRAALAGDPAAAAQALMSWLDRRQASPALFEDFAAAAADPELEVEARVLDERLYGEGGGSSFWSGRRLYRRVARARGRRPERERQETGFPPLNPV